MKMAPRLRERYHLKRPVEFLRTTDTCSLWVIPTAVAKDHVASRENFRIYLQIEWGMAKSANMQRCTKKL
jgi:hypothetical protein